MTTRQASCADCSRLACKTRQENQYPDFCPTKNAEPELLQKTLEAYGETESQKIALTAACMEGETYGQLTRVEETIEFIRRMGYKKIGIATCMGLISEAQTFARILDGCGIDYHMVCCKIGAVDKETIGVSPEKKLNGGQGHESMCNPILQAQALAAAGAEFNVVIGLCVGHDTLFLQNTKLPCTVMIVKDRVLAHNPVGALYTAKSSYSRFKKELGR
jgi:uncharacterized metal-binding protein